MTCKIKIYTHNGGEPYTCHQVRLFSDKWKEEFRKVNRVEGDGKRDRSYMRYCESIDDFLNQCKCLEEKCSFCSPEDHDGDFCRCESRNMALAKYKRSKV